MTTMRSDVLIWFRAFTINISYVFRVYSHSVEQNSGVYCASVCCSCPLSDFLFETSFYSYELFCCDAVFVNLFISFFLARFVGFYSRAELSANFYCQLDGDFLTQQTSAVRWEFVLQDLDSKPSVLPPSHSVHFILVNLVVFPNSIFVSTLKWSKRTNSCDKIEQCESDSSMK